MAIRRMISRDPAEFRAFQSRMTTVGKIRLGLFETPEGRRGRPVKLGTFRLTADNEALIRAVAEEYGGEAEQWTPQGAKTPQWQVITDAYALEVYVVNGQNIDPVYEAWMGGRTCVRRCDGEWEQIKQDHCLCNGPNRPQDTRELCKITVRVQVMLKRIQGLGSWLLESHGENAAMELSTFREFIANAPMPVPAMLRLRKETRRQWNAEKGKFDTLDFYVPWLDVSVVNAATIAIGGDALTQALSAAGAPSAIGGTAQHAIEARPVSAPVTTERPDGLPPGPNAGVTPDIEALRPVILADIEARTTVEALEEVKAKLISRGINDTQVREAWASKLAAVQAADGLRERAQQLNEADRHILNDAVDALPQAERETLKASLGGRPYRVLVTGSRTWTNVDEINHQLTLAKITHPGRMVVVHGDCPQGADALANTWAEVNGVPVERFPADWNGPDGKGAGFARNQAMVDTRPDIILAFIRHGSKGATHCAEAAENAGLKVLRFVDDEPLKAALRDDPIDRAALNEARADLGMEPLPPVTEPGYQVGDVVNVGGIEFTKISDNPFESGSPAAHVFELGKFAEAVEGVVETTGPILPDVPADDYDADELYASLMTGASKQAPPLTTSEVNDLIKRTFGVDSTTLVEGRDLARLRAGLKSGAVTWR